MRKKLIGLGVVAVCLYVAPVQTLAVAVLLGVIALYVMSLSSKQLPEDR